MFGRSAEQSLGFGHHVLHREAEFLEAGAAGGGSAEAVHGDSVTMNRFDASAPGGTCLKEFGFTVENVVAKAKALLG